ncbi:hypothetical protein [Rhizobium sp. FY34]|uniref:hypothetical protein n=1 Tax=Rhizobium sp. FY34 TaxID=2562309 RepID=UPI0010BF748D|nr:hypothetical protein [Rhizobium sp. FY34]
MSTSHSTKTTLPAAFARHYEKLGIDSNLRARLETSASRIFDLGRRTTEQTFEIGNHLDEAAVLLYEGVFDKWVKNRCGIAPRTARGYMSVFRNLSDFRDELVDLSVGPTALFHLAHATHEQIREAIAHAEEHGQLRVSDVKDIVANGEEAEDKGARRDVFAAGGVTGLKALIAIKTRDGLKLLIARIKMICDIIKAALEKPRVIKDTLAKEINDPACIARLELENLAMFVQPINDPRRNACPIEFPKDSEWGRVADVLVTLGAKENWPKMAELRGWLHMEVLPVLEWAISKDRKPKWPLAPADDLVVVAAVGDAAELMPEAEAERVDAPVEVDANPDRFAERFGDALEAATGGMMTVSRETPKVRKPLAKVPPLAPEAAVGDFVETSADETSMDEASSSPAMTA